MVARSRDPGRNLAAGGRPVLAADAAVELLHAGGHPDSVSNNTQEVDDVSRRRTIKFLSVLAATSLIAAACSSGDDDDDAVSDDTQRGHHPGDGGRGHGRPAPRRPSRPEPDTTEAEGTEPETTEGEATEALPGAEDVGTVGGSGCGIPARPVRGPGRAGR